MRITNKWSLLMTFPLAYVSFVAKPFERGFECDDISIQKPFLPLQIGLHQLLLFIIIVPIIIIVASENYLSPDVNEFESGLNTSKRKRVRDLLTVFYFGLMLNFLLVMCSKNAFGRLRPHAIHFCHALHYCRNGIVSSFNCIFLVS